jgi:hypothetical protein
MRMSIAWVLGFTSLICVAQTQEPPPQQPQRTELPPLSRHPQAMLDGGVREVVESIVIAPIQHVPFTSTLATEVTKYAADGTSMTFVNERHIARDGQGRVYQERWLLVPKNSKTKSFMNWIQIADPKQRTLYNCSPQKHLCDLLAYDPGEELSAASPHNRNPGTVQSSTGSQTWEDLGTRNILGIDTFGARETSITNAGVMGNDQPLTSMSEYWHSQQLGINLLSIRSSPFFGRQTFTITELTLGDPDIQLFEIPPGFKVNDLRKDPPISH